MSARCTGLGFLLLIALAVGGLTAPQHARGAGPASGAPAPAGPEGQDRPPEDAPAPPAGPDTADWATFVYQKPAPILRLRLALEEAGLMSIAVIGYLIVQPPPSIEGVPTPIWPWQKLMFQPGTWSFEADPFGTNLEGHVASGTLYYAFARGSRVSIPEAFAWTFAASLAWELVEYNEPVSISDMIITPVGGMAIGEALTQLSGWFDRSGNDSIRRAFAWILDPPKKFHDWMDKAAPVVDPVTAGWHEFQAFAAAGFMRQGLEPGPNYGIVQFGFQTRLFRVPGYQATGRGDFGFWDGNASRITLMATFQGSRLVDSLFDTETAVAGRYARNLEVSDGQLTGWDYFVGATVGYENGRHVWNVEGKAPPNRIALVRMPGVVFRPRAFLGRFELDMGLDASLLFGAVDPLGWPQAAPPPAGVAYPPVLVEQGYYFALGLRLAGSFQARYGVLALGGAACVDSFRAITGGNAVPPPGQMASLSDRRDLASAWLRARFEDPPIEAGMRAEWRARSGVIDDVRVSQREQALLGTFAVIF